MIFAAAVSDVRKANSDGSYDYPALAENFRFFNQLKYLDLTLTSAVSAAMRGEETIALYVIAKNPAVLLKKEIVKNSVDVEYEVTPLQAAIIANDIQLIERMKELFASLTTDLEGNPVDGLAEMHRQMMEIYTESLTHHCQIQQEKIAALLAQQAAGNNIDPKTVRAAQENLKAYSDALASNDLNTLVEAHHRAQAHNVFNFQPYEEAVRQDLRQGTYCLIKKNPELRRRPSNFKYLVDRSSHAGCGYKFACAEGMPSCFGRALPCLKTYVEQKQQAFRAYYAACAGMRPQA